jgi:hypothetical protein
MGHPGRFVARRGVRFVLRAKAHLSDDETVAKMGHPAWSVWEQWRRSMLRFIPTVSQATFSCECFAVEFLSPSLEFFLPLL